MNQQNEPHAAPPSMAEDWSQLPKDLLQVISEKLDNEFDKLRFRSVCSTWRSSAPKKNHQNHLILFKCPIPSNNNNSTTTYPLSKRSIFLIKPLPNQHNRTLNPWLIKIGPDSRGRTRLWNPLSRAKQFPLHLPHVIDVTQHRFLNLGHEFVIGDFPSQPLPIDNSIYTQKVVVAEHNGGKDPILLTIQDTGNLAIFRCGDDRWTVIPEEIMRPYDDVCVFNGLLIAVDQICRTVAVGPDLSLELMAGKMFWEDKNFLVESDGELLLVVKYLDVDGEGMAVRFFVLRLDEKKKRWVQVRNLGDRVLFLGEDSTFSASASASDLCTGNGNCVIFRDDIFPNAHSTELGISVFHLDQQRTSPLSDFPCYAKLFWPPPEWVGLRIDNNRVRVLD